MKHSRFVPARGLIAALTLSACGASVAPGPDSSAADGPPTDAATGQDALAPDATSTGEFTLCGELGFATLRALAWRPDGYALAVGGGGQAVDVVRGVDGAEAQQFVHRQGGVTALAYSPDGALLASGRSNGDVTLVRAADGAFVREFVHDAGGAVAGVAFTPDGRYVVTGGARVVHVWRVDSGEWVRSLRVPAGVASMALSADGARVAAGSFGVVSVAALSGEGGVTELPGETAPALGVAFAPDGSAVAASWQTAEGPSGSVVATAYRLGADAGLVATIRAPGGNARAVAFAPDGDALAVGLERGAELWTVRAGGQWLAAPVRAGVFDNPDAPTDLRFSPDGRALAAVFSGTRVTVWDVFARAERFTLARRVDASHGVAFLPEGDALFDGAHVWTVGARAWSGSVPLAARAWSLARDGAHVLGVGADSRLALFALPRGEVVRAYDLPAELVGPQALALAPDGASFALAQGAVISVRSTDSGAELRRRFMVDRSADALTYSPDGRFLLAGREHPRAFTAADLAPALPWLEELAAPAWAFSPDGETLALALASTELRLVRVASGQGRATPLSGSALDLAFAPDGAVLVARGPSALSVLDGQTGAERAGFAGVGYASPGRGVAFTRDGTLFATPSAAGTISLYCARPR